MKIVFKGFMVLLASSATAALTIFAYHKILGGGIAHDDMKYQDFVSLSLTALGLMMTILGFFVAAAGVIGWTTIESKLKDHSVSYFRDQLSESGALRAELEKLITDIAYEGVENIKYKNGADSESDYND